MLKEADRLKLDNIVQQMHNNNESDENIQFVVADFKKKYDVVSSVPKIDNVSNQNILDQTKSRIDEGISAYISKQKQDITTAKELGRQFLYGQEQTERSLLGSLYGGLSDKRINAPEPTGLSQSIARLSGEYLAPQPAFFGAPGEAVIGAKLVGQTGEKLLSKAAPQISKTATSVKQAVSPLVESLKEHVAPIVKKGLTFVGNVLSSINPSYYEYALDKEIAGDSIFKGEFNPKIFTEYGDKAQKAINFLQTEYGKAVELEREALKQSSQPIIINDVIKKIDDELLASKYGRETILDKTDLAEIRNVRSKLVSLQKTTGGISPAEMHAVAKKIQDSLQYSQQKVNNVTSEGERVLKGIAKNLRDRIGGIIPDYQEVNAKYSDISKLKNQLIPLVRNQNVAKNLKNLLKKDDYTISLFAELDKLAPEKYKFMDGTISAIVREPFEKIFSGQGGGSGSAEGMANILRAYIGKESPEKIPFMSPKVQKGIIKSIGSVSGAIGSVPDVAAQLPYKKSIPVLSKIGVGYIPQSQGGYEND